MALGYHRLLGRYRAAPALLLMVLAGIALLNAADLVLTLQALDRGAGEANPVMTQLFAADPALAAVFKLSLGSAVVAAMWLLRRYRRMLELSLVLLAGFVLLTLYHLGGRLYLEP